ncbi:hypothetical protein Pelo_2492 [Pelomyxa schiedti]|nr:hypothetical protein Pelo_2492 [Pelomyxa schiedti]
MGCGVSASPVYFSGNVAATRLAPAHPSHTNRRPTTERTPAAGAPPRRTIASDATCVMERTDSTADCHLEMPTHEYCVGIADIDSHHKLILCLIGKMDALIEAETPDLAQALAQQCKTFQERIAQYLKHEECLMRISKYPDFDYHAAVHTECIAIVTTAVNDTSQGRLEPQMCFPKIIKEWLLSHIKTHDKAFADWMSTYGAPELSREGMYLDSTLATPSL